MKKYKYKGETIEASSKEEAIKAFASKVKANATKVTASFSLPNPDDECYELYGNDFLREHGDIGEVYQMGELDEMLGEISPSEAIFKAYHGYDYTANSDKGDFNPNEDYFAFDGLDNIVSIREGYLADWLRDNIDTSSFCDWLLDEKKDEYMEILRDNVENEITNVATSGGKMFGFEFPKLGYQDVVYDRDSDDLSAFGSVVDYDYTMTLDENLEALHDEILSDNPDAEDEDEEENED